MDYMTVKEAVEKWAITPRWVQVLCVQGKKYDKMDKVVLLCFNWEIEGEKTGSSILA